MKTEPHKEEFWKNHIEPCANGGNSQRNYCKHHNLSLSTFGYWKRKLSPHAEKTHFFPLVLSELKDNAEQKSSGISLHLDAHHLRIEIDEYFSVSTLKRVMAALEEM